VVSVIDLQFHGFKDGVQLAEFSRCAKRIDGLAKPLHS
jgi:hypothetical protein